jgi:hypothetical protein
MLRLVSEMLRAIVDARQMGFEMGGALGKAMYSSEKDVGQPFTKDYPTFRSVIVMRLLRNTLEIRHLRR